MTHTLLVLDDDRNVLSLVRTYFGGPGWRVEGCAEADAALRLAGSDLPYDAVICDLHFTPAHRSEGFDIVRRIRERRPRCAVLLLYLSGGGPAMARKNRRDVIDDSVVGAYHIWTRCARRAFLAGLDLVTGLDFCHRKTWITQRIEELSKVFAVECCDDTVMDNHLHLILRNRPDKAHEWSAEEVARRWLLLNRSAIDLEPAPTQREIEALASDRKQIAELRMRLASISWYMGSLKQAISVMANDEDDVTGAFFAERFGCRRLKDDPALLTCSLYINMNPIRAGVVDDLNEPRSSRRCMSELRTGGRTIRREPSQAR